MIDSFGKEINRNKLIAVLSHIALQKEPGSTIVTDSVTSSGLKTFIESKGGIHLRYMRGYKNVINKGIELNSKGINAPLMIETSGHGAMKENYNLDDGAYLAVKIIIEAVKRKNAGGGGIGEGRTPPLLHGRADGAAAGDEGHWERGSFDDGRSSNGAWLLRAGLVGDEARTQ